MASSSVEPCPGTSKDGPLEGFTEDVKEALDGIIFEDVPEKVTRLLPKVLPVLMQGFDSSDLLSMRLVSHSWKSVVDSHLISTWDSKGMSSTDLPFICLTGPAQLEAFQRSLGRFRNTHLGPIPFELRVGLATPGRGLLTGTNQHWDDLVRNLFWDTFFDVCQCMGNRFTAVALHVLVTDQTSHSVAERTCRVVMNCLKQMPNLECLSITTSSAKMDNTFAKHYEVLQTKGRLKGRQRKLPDLPKMKVFELVTLVQSKKSAFLDLFLKQHGESLKKLRLVCTVDQLKGFREEVIKGAENVEEVSFEVIDESKGRGVELLLEKLPKVEVKPGGLKHVDMTLSWNWRACDVLGLLKWLGKHYGDCELKLLALETWTNSLEDPDPTEMESEVALLVVEHLGVAMLVRNREMMKNRKEKRLLELKGNKVNFEVGIDQLKLPRVETITVTTEYKGSWQWLKAFPRDALKKLELVYRLEDPEETYKGGFLKGMAEKNEVIWKMFPKLKDLTLIWAKKDREELILWHISRLYYEDFLEGRRNQKGKIKREALLARTACCMEIINSYY